MKSLFAKPHLFISYSRKDAALSQFLYRFLTSVGFKVYYDKEKSLIGENFAVKIVNELRRSDAVVAIVSDDSAASPWCQAELYHAHAVKTMIAPIRVGLETITLPAPLDSFMRDIHHTVVTNESTYPEAAARI